MPGMSVANARDPVGEGAVFQPVPDFSPDRAAPRPLAMGTALAHFSRNYEQNADILRHSPGKRFFQPLMCQGKAVTVQVDQYFGL